MLTPLDVRKKEFRRCFRGYDEQEVDRFLDLVIDTMERLIEQKNELQEQLERMESMVARYTELEEVLKSTLVMAQKTADEVKEAANRQSENTLEEAAAKAEQMIARARGEAKVIINRAHEEGTQVLDDAAGKAERIMEEYGLLHKQAGLFRAKFRSFLDVQLKMLDSDLGVLEDQERPALADVTDTDTDDPDAKWDDYDLTVDEAESAAAETAVSETGEDEAETDAATGTGKERLA